MGAVSALGEVTSRPSPLTPSWPSIPQSLRAMPSWLVWRYEQCNGRWTKVPRRACGGGYAKTNDPDTWANFDAARAAAQAGADGVGLVLTGDLVGIDLDHVLDEAGTLEPWAAEVLDHFLGCYVERSPGGDGLRIFCRGKLPRSGKGGPDNHLEGYDRSSPRYMTVTGHPVREGDVIEAQAALDWLHETYMAKRAPTLAAAAAPASSALSDEEVLRLASKARNGGKFSTLFAGGGGDDASSNDAALLGILSFYTQDTAQLDRLFRRSGLMREKWDERRGEQTYGERTIEHVLAMSGERYRPRSAVAANDHPSLGVDEGAPSVHVVEAPRPLPAELLPVDPLPMTALPEALRPWITDVAERMHCPPDFVAVPMLAAAASLVARHVGIRPQRRTDWIERGNLWALIVGRPGLMKSPAMSQALAPMERLEARAAEAFNARTAQHQADALAAKLRAEANVKAARTALKKNSSADVSALLGAEEQQTAPTRQRYVVNDLTYEKLGEILSENPTGVLSVRDEMRGLFMSLAREESAPARAFYLQAWSGGSYTFDRIGRGTVMVADARLSIIGGIQPGPLSELLLQARRGTADDGMLERFLISWPDAPGDWREVDRWPDSAAKRRAWEVFDRLDALTADELGAEFQQDAPGDARGLPFLRFDEDAREAFGEWRQEFELSIRAAEAEGLEGALSKFRHHVPALALALHVIDGGTGAVTLAATERALALAEYFESHARRLHASGRNAVRAARMIIEKVRAKALPDPFTARDVYRNQWAGLSDRSAVADALDLLAAHGWVIEVSLETGGRPTTTYSLTEGARHGQVD